MRIKIFGVATLGLLAPELFLQGCSSSPGTVERELIIAPAPVACAGDPPATCLNVSEPDGDTWLMRFDEIEGFSYEPGYTYEILVREPPVNREMAVVPRLALVRVTSKEAAPAAAASGPLDRTEWRLQRASNIAAHADDITASFHGAEGWVEGFAGCNQYLAALTVEGQRITITPPATTDQLCATAVQDRERTFLQALAKAQSYAVHGGSLELTLAGGGTIRFRAASS